MKRSANVMLAVMAATGIGTTAYSLMPRDDCERTPPGVAQTQSCRSSGRGSSFHGYGSSSNSPSNSSSTASPSLSRSNSVAFAGQTERGGFGGFARSIGSHFSAGG
jgi:hypothetical protein